MTSESNVGGNVDLTFAVVASGVWDLSTQKHEGAGMRYLRARRFLRELLTGERVTALAFEDVRRHVGASAAHVYGGVVGHIMAACEECHVPYTAIGVAAIKRTATGKGNATKDEMVDAAARRFGVKPKDDNEADAIWLAASMAITAQIPGTFVGIDPGTKCGWAVLRAAPSGSTVSR